MTGRHQLPSKRWPVRFRLAHRSPLPFAASAGPRLAHRGAASPEALLATLVILVLTVFLWHQVGRNPAQSWPLPSPALTAQARALLATITADLSRSRSAGFIATWTRLPPPDGSPDQPHSIRWFMLPAVFGLPVSNATPASAPIEMVAYALVPASKTTAALYRLIASPSLPLEAVTASELAESTPLATNVVFLDIALHAAPTASGPVDWFSVTLHLGESTAMASGTGDFFAVARPWRLPTATRMTSE
ncbi:MAG: hypothetical protein OZSIB_1095 [Candidatus Ozemobacter sibiricus]|jgi:hypothetical protein|uniref:Uncharacterized protein n=1 Tax=Candidatus Ozemobacter sibiricus TaxID=2268124 RepID=A0A367ZMY3_9BACT|nr:MAG: hypothetical protein OZSIB_1095 [Candidatus Ozemobacter sibiricus]